MLINLTSTNSNNSHTHIMKYVLTNIFNYYKLASVNLQWKLRRIHKLIGSNLIQKYNTSAVTVFNDETGRPSDPHCRGKLNKN